MVLYIMACHLKIDADPDPAYHFDADPAYHFDADADPDPAYHIVRIRILPYLLFAADPDPQHCKIVTYEVICYAKLLVLFT